ncbi:D-lactate dehydrogenase (cytochrome)/glycolate oxidase [Desulfobaculum xiamenense]|uniref:D-lactate dehydrogenase (Cytochrome)/glycolate oxidase n=1 Tax=Desulfobaculum xiamenense TaxID=995050 RepID=A0A846QKE8_9BACT|nr:FAD-linked oxidase C-terminal domain-containing protein [Desulfobaculum xiamenense]NJB68611.1 D-lactate dehydrogenase (cytochrome)/glycolate oxidase [Desulfobaculum xiamenense]
MLTATQKRFLTDLFPGDACVLTPEETCAFGADSSRIFAQPWAVVRPETLDQTRSLLKWAHEERVPLFPRSRGTNVVGDCTPKGGGVVVSALRMNRIVEVSGDDFVAVAQPGVVTADLQRACEAKGLFYPPDPASVRISTIGGNVSTNAGGMRAVKYGVTRDYVLGLEAVLPGGEVIRTGGRTHKNVVGLDLTRLFVGAEGTLGFITEVTLKLLPRPEASASVLAGFAALEAALDAARDVFRAGILPVAMEFMADEVLRALAKVTDAPWPQGTQAVLLLKLDGSGETLPLELKRLETALAPSSPSFMARGMGADEEALWEVRRLINPASFRVAPDKMSDDVTVPRGRVAEAVARIRDAGREAGLTVLVFGHLGDGNLHVNIMHDAAGGEGERARTLKETVLGIVLDVGGTMSGEHGVGLTKRPYIDRQIGGRELEIMRQVKAVFDPHGILNPGKAY